MNRCVKCNLDIADDSIMCPLCKSVLKSEGEKTGNLEDGVVRKSLIYPEVVSKRKKLILIIKLTILACVFLECVMIYLNVKYFDKCIWSLGAGFLLAYACFSFAYSGQHNSSLKKKIIWQAVFAVPVIIIIDYSLGYSGWSLNWVIPIMVLFLDAAVLVLAIIFRKQWQRYVMVQTVNVIIGILCLLFWALNLVEFKILSLSAFAFSTVLYIAMIIIGERRSISELGKRFRV